MPARGPARPTPPAGRRTGGFVGGAERDILRPWELRGGIGNVREFLLYSTFLMVVFGAMFGYLYATSEVIEVQVMGKRIQQTIWRPGLGTNEYIIETKKNGDLALSSLPLMGYFWGAAEAYERLRVGGGYRLRIVEYPFIQRPGNVAVIQVIE